MSNMHDGSLVGVDSHTHTRYHPPQWNRRAVTSIHKLQIMTPTKHCTLDYISLVLTTFVYVQHTKLFLCHILYIIRVYARHYGI